MEKVVLPLIMGVGLLLTGFVILGRYLEAITRGRASEAIRRLMREEEKPKREIGFHA